MRQEKAKAGDMEKTQPGVTPEACLVAQMKRWKRGVSPRGIGPGPKMRANDPSITLTTRARSGNLTEAHRDGNLKCDGNPTKTV